MNSHQSAYVKSYLAPPTAKEANGGSVYVMSNPAMPGLLKVGFTTKEPGDRAEALFTTGIPVPFRVNTRYWCLNHKWPSRQHIDYSRTSTTGKNGFSALWLKRALP
jgi:hypothetical protein